MIKAPKMSRNIKTSGTGREGPRTSRLVITTRTIRIKPLNVIAEPKTLGYSLVGEVTGIGRNVDGVSVGDRVACAGAGHANHAEVVAIPSNLFVPVRMPMRNRKALTRQKPLRSVRPALALPLGGMPLSTARTRPAHWLTSSAVR